MNAAPALNIAQDRRPLVFTYTMLHTYRNICAHQAGRRFIIKDIPFVETEAMRRGNAVHNALELRMSTGKPLPVDMHDYEQFARAFDGKKPKCEPKLACTKEGKPCDYFGPAVWGRGKADVVLIEGERAYLLDWKTGSGKFEDPFELELHAMLLRIKYPQLRTIKGQFCWLKEMRLGPLHDLSDVASTWSTVCHLVRLIETDRANNSFDKEPGSLCGGAWGSCPVVDCEHRRVQ